MRRIDADAYVKYCDEKWIPLNVDAVNAQPTIEPRKPGHWIVHRDWIDNGECGYECSECHRCYDYAMNFCGYCGSYNGGEGNDGE